MRVEIESPPASAKVIAVHWHPPVRTANLDIRLSQSSRAAFGESIDRLILLRVYDTAAGFQHA